MRKSERRITTGVLLDFTRLKSSSQEMFISQMNEFLLSSYRKKKILIEQWEFENSAPENNNKQTNSR
nr:hypothetical protein FFPRI1PSEUD_24370 [Pseudomonas sp. FFPRI_1]